MYTKNNDLDIETHPKDTQRYECQVFRDILIAKEFGSDPLDQDYCIKAMRRMLNRTDFYVFPDVFDAICQMDDEGIPCDRLSLTAQIGIEDTDLIYRLSDIGLSSTITIKEDILTHIRILKKASADRKMWELGQDMVKKASEDGSQPEKYGILFDRFCNILDSIKTSSTGPVSVIDLFNNYASVIESGAEPKVPTFIHSIDTITKGGFSPGTLSIIAARPSVGKTALMIDIANSMATNGRNVIVFSLEMTSNELIERILLSTGRVTPAELSYKSFDWQKFEEAGAHLDNLPLMIDADSYKLDEIIGHIECLADDGKADAVFIDYLGLIVSQGNDKLLLSQKLGIITRALKLAAKQAKVPIILLCQLNRDACKDGRPPQLHDLRDSGCIEQDADLVLMLDRKDAVEDVPPSLSVWVRKNRQGKAGMCIIMQPNETYTHFEDKGVYVND